MSDHVKFKFCIVVNANEDAQAVVVVQNTASVAVSIAGAVRSDFGSNVDCAVSPLNPGFTRGCFAPTATDVGSSAVLNAVGHLEVNGVTNAVSYGIAHVQ